MKRSCTAAWNLAAMFGCGLLFQIQGSQRGRYYGFRGRSFILELRSPGVAHQLVNAIGEFLGSNP